MIKSLKSKFIPAKSGAHSHLLILAHGRTGNLKILEWYSKRFAIENLAFLTIEAPFADKREDQKDEGFSWYLPGKVGLEDSRKRIVEMIRELEAEGISANQIFWLGFSQGAAMGLDLALRADFTLGGFLCISGYCIQPDSYPAAFGAYAKEQRILITHGTRDSILEWEKIKPQYHLLSSLGVSFDLKIFDKPHSFHLKEEVPMLEAKLREWMNSM